MQQRGNIILTCALAVVITACGRNESVSDVDITNGFSLSESDRPAVRAIKIDDKFYCTGTFLSDRTMLTAAHCVNNKRALSSYIVLGRSPISIFYYGEPSQFLATGKPTFKEAIRSDSALLIFGEAMVHVRSFPKLSRKRPVSGDLVTLVGYGLANELQRESAGHKRRGQSVVVTADTDYEPWFIETDGLPGPPKASKLKRGTYSGTLAGDSGGPMFAKDDSILGTSSWGNMRGTAPLTNKSFHSRIDGQFPMDAFFRAIHCDAGLTCAQPFLRDEEFLSWLLDAPIAIDQKGVITVAGPQKAEASIDGLMTMDIIVGCKSANTLTDFLPHSSAADILGACWGQPQVVLLVNRAGQSLSIAATTPFADTRREVLNIGERAASF